MSAIIIEMVKLTCEGCEKDFMGREPKYCCDGQECGCRGMPIDQVVCSEECYDKIMKHDLEKIYAESQEQKSKQYVR